MLRATFICAAIALYTLLLGPPLLLYCFITKRVDPLYWAGVKGVMFFVNCVGVRVRVKGTERIPQGTCIFAANHTSSADAPAVVGAIPRRIAILLKRSLFEWPIVGQSFLIYPEGTRSPDGRLQEFKKGAAVMAIKSGVPVVPVACSGAHRVMEKRKLKITPGEILVEFLGPIDPTNYSLDQRDELLREIHDRLAAGLPPDQRPVGFPGAG